MTDSRGTLRRRLFALFGLLVIALSGGWEAWKVFHIPPPAPPVQEETKPLPPAQKPAAPKVVQKPKPEKPRPAPVSPPKVVTPVAPPPPVVPAPVVPLPPPQPSGEWQGTDTSITHDGQIVIHNDHQWIQFWAEHHPDEAAPDVDFASQMVIGVFAGPRPAESFSIKILNVRSASGQTIVDYQEKLPPPGTLAFNVMVHPYDIKVIPKATGSVKFNKLAVVDPNRISR